MSTSTAAKAAYVKAQGQTRNHRLQWSARQRYQLKKRYGITTERYEELYAEQDGGCAICGQTESSVMYGHEPRLVVDHNEFTNKVRGLLCRQCNTKLHAVEDDQWLRRATEYLSHHE